MPVALSPPAVVPARIVVIVSIVVIVLRIVGGIELGVLDDGFAARKRRLRATLGLFELGDDGVEVEPGHVGGWIVEVGVALGLLLLGKRLAEESDLVGK